MQMPKTMNGEEYLTQTEAVRYLNTSPGSFKEAVEEHNITHPDDQIVETPDPFRSRVRYYKKSDLDKFLRPRRVE